MKKMSLLAVLLVFIAALYGCEGTTAGGAAATNATSPATDTGTTTPTVSSLINAAKTALEAKDVKTANSKYKEAFALDAANKDANFGIAMTDLIMLIENPDVVSVFTALNETPPSASQLFVGPICTSVSTGNGCVMETCKIGNIITSEEEICDGNTSGSGWFTPALTKAGLTPKQQAVLKGKTTAMMKTLKANLPASKPSTLTKAKAVLNKSIPDTAPSISQIQGILLNTVLPVVDSSIAKLKAIENTGYTFTVTTKMKTGSTSSTVLDDGEFYLFDAVLNAVKSGIYAVNAYNLDVDYNIIEADILSALNGPYGGSPTSTSAAFLTLKTDGQSKMTSSLSALKEAAAQLENAYNYAAYSDPDSTTDGGIDFSDLTAEDKTMITKMIDAVQMALNGQVTAGFTVLSGTATFTISDGTTTITHTGGGFGNADGSMSSSIDLTKLFSAPLDRTDLPTLAYDLAPDSTLSQQYNEPIHKYLGPGPDGMQNFYADDDVVTSSSPMPTSNFPDLTFNGVFPGGVPFPPVFDTVDGILVSGGSTLAVDALMGWGDAITTDGTNLLVYNDYYAGGSNYVKEILKIYPSTGGVINAIAISQCQSAPCKQVSWIDGLAYTGGKLYATGGYSDVTSNGTGGYNYSYTEGSVFIINATTGLVGTVIPVQSGSQYNPDRIYGLTSDGTYLYGGMHYHTNCDMYGECDCNDGIVRFLPSATSVSVADMWMSYEMNTEHLAFDTTNNVLWVDGAKHDSSGGLLNFYVVPGSVGAAFNGKLYDAERGKIRIYQQP